MKTNKKYSEFPWTTFKDEYPGPWNQSTNTFIESNGKTIAEVLYGNDAMIMCVAPEMLEVCKQVKQSLEDMDAARGTSHALELSKLDYIIAKAEGKGK